MWDVIKDWVYNIIHFFYTFCGDWGLAIIIVTIIFRIIVAPLMHVSARSSFMMQKIQPLMQEIQTRFADDPVRQQQEMQKMYADIKFNPLIGCLPADAYLHRYVPDAARNGFPRGRGFVLLLRSGSRPGCHAG